MLGSPPLLCSAFAAVIGIASGCATASKGPGEDPLERTGGEEAPSTSGDAQWSAAMERSATRFAEGNTDAGVREARRAVGLAEQHFAEDDRRRDRSTLELASLLLQTGALDEADELVTTVLARAEQRRADAESFLASALKFTGTIAMLRRDFDTAQQNYERAVTLSESAAGPDHPETAKHLGNLATILAAKGEIGRAEDQLLRAVRIWDTAAFEHPVYTVQTLSLLASLRLSEGAFDEALELYDRGLAIQEAAWGTRSPRLTKLLSQYAEALRAAGRDAEAKRLEARITGP